MNRTRGFALITVLWLITAVSAAVGLGLATTRLGQRTSGNRVVLTRGRWAAEACLAIAQARWREQRLGDTATIDLGRRTRCRWTVDDPGARVNVNTADRLVLERLGLDSAAMARLLAARPLASLAQLDIAATNLTTDGPGTINLNAASPAVLQAFPGLSAEAVERILAGRALSRPVMSLDALAGLLSPAGRAVLMAHYADLARVATFTPSRLIVTAQGWVEGDAPRATIEIMTVPLAERLAVVRRRMW